MSGDLHDEERESVVQETREVEGSCASAEETKEEHRLISGLRCVELDGGWTSGHPKQSRPGHGWRSQARPLRLLMRLEAREKNLSLRSGQSLTRAHC